MRRWLWVVMAAGCVDANAPVHPGDDTPLSFDVPAGSSASALTDRLATQGVIPSTWKWKLYLRQADASCVKAGKHNLARSMSMAQVLEALCAPPVPDDEPFTVIEGWRILEIDAALAAKGWIKPGEYAKLAKSKAVKLPFEITSPTLEGYLYPDTYRIEPKKFTAQAFIERQLATFQERFLAKKPDLGGHTLHEVVVVASLVEREEPSKANRPVVTGVMWHRLKDGWNLGIDASSRYELPDWNNREVFLAHLRDPNDVYNTRLRPGLPPTAIGNPDVDSLDAAVHPKATEFMYYLHDAQGVFHGAKNSAEHEANRAKFNVY
jgi:UPF0755 protein